jgi:hypothetical protein
MPFDLIDSEGHITRRIDQKVARIGRGASVLAALINVAGAVKCSVIGYVEYATSRADDTAATFTLS